MMRDRCSGGGKEFCIEYGQVVMGMFCLKISEIVIRDSSKI